MEGPRNNRSAWWLRPGNFPGRRWLAGTSGGTVLLVVVLALAWYVSSFFVPEYVFPTIGSTAGKFVSVVTTTTSYKSLVYTLQRVLGGFLISALTGIALGVGMGTQPKFYTICMPLVKLIMGIPALTWVLLSIIWFSSTELRVWFIMFILVFPIVTTNTYDGVRSISPELHQMVQSLRPSPAAMLRLLVIPSALPFIFSGLRIGLSFGGRIAVFAEALSASSGIGAQMFMMDQLFDTAGIIVWTILLVMALSLLDLVLTTVEARWFRWRPAAYN